jgi:soluble lytic murein transglycosylase-like protein
MRPPLVPEPAGLSRLLARIDAIKTRFRTPRADPPLAQTFSGMLSSVGAGAPSTIREALTEAALRHQLDPNLLLAVAETESGFRPDAVSPRGARGLMQLMPGTAGRFGLTEPFDLEANADAGARYLKEQLDRFGGDVALALAAYNAGPGAVLRYRGIPPYQETRAFVSRVLAKSRLPAPPAAPGVSRLPDRTARPARGQSPDAPLTGPTSAR